MEKKEKILEKRAMHRKLSRMILQGVEYSEEVEVKAVDDQTYTARIRPLGEGEILECFKNAGIEFGGLENAKAVEKSLGEVMLLQHQIIAKAARGAKDETWTPEEVGRLLKFGESFALGRKILEISGVIGTPVKAVETFRQQPVQPAS